VVIFTLEVMSNFDRKIPHDKEAMWLVFEEQFFEPTRHDIFPSNYWCKVE
jgi:hypothetical protein